MSTGEKLLVLIVAVTLVAVLTATIWVAIRTRRVKRKAERMNRNINDLR